MDFIRSLYKKALGINFAYLLVLGLVVKAIVHDISIPTVLISIPVLTFEGYKLYLKFQTPEPVQIDEAIMKRLDSQKEEVDAIKSKLTAQQLERSVKPPIARW